MEGPLTKEKKFCRGAVKGIEFWGAVLGGAVVRGAVVGGVVVGGTIFGGAILRGAVVGDCAVVGDLIRSICLEDS